MVSTGDFYAVKRVEFYIPSGGFKFYPLELILDGKARLMLVLEEVTYF
jgi:hypothetical protein